MYVQRQGQRWNIGSRGRFELTFFRGQIVAWFDLRIDPDRLVNLVSGTVLGPVPILAPEFDDPKRTPSAGRLSPRLTLSSRQRLVEVSETRVVVASELYAPTHTNTPPQAAPPTSKRDGPPITLMNDELQAYVRLAKERKGKHYTVNHGKGEYARGDVHCNSAESFFALLKRGIHGSFHHVGRQHLRRYCDEFAFRWNHRKVSDGERTEAALRLAPGVRLAYRA